MEESFDAFVVERGPAMLRFGYVLCGDGHLAEDMVQEVLARVHLKWSKIVRMHAPEAYVRTAIVREYLSWRRRRASTEAVMAELPERSGGGDPQQQVVDRSQMWALLSQLPRTQRAVLVLRFYCDLPDEEIAQLLGWAKPTVRAHASRGLARMRTILGPAARPDAPGSRRDPSALRPGEPGARPASPGEPGSRHRRQVEGGAP